LLLFTVAYNLFSSLTFSYFLILIKLYGYTICFINNLIWKKLYILAIKLFLDGFVIIHNICSKQPLKARHYLHPSCHGQHNNL
jgi:uncharacterized membrane protein